MDTNDLNRRVRFALALDDDDVFDCNRLAGYTATLEQITSWRIKEGEAGYAACPPEAIRAMLNGLVVQKRGPRDTAPAEPNNKIAAEDKPAQVNSSPTAQSLKERNTGNAAGKAVIDNNEILKQIRIALSLKTDEVFGLINAGGGKLTKSELNALFRNPTARNYRRCGDQVLRWFLSGLAKARSA